MTFGKTCALSACLAIQSLAAPDAVRVHAPSPPARVVLPADARAYLYLEGESAVEGDAWGDPAQASRTVFRTAQEPDDTWWGAFRAPDNTRMGMRGADIDHPWHSLGWSVPEAALAPGLYDAYARVMVTAGGRCELAVTTGAGLPDRAVPHAKPDIHWVHAGSVELAAGARDVRLHLRTWKSAVRVDTVLLLKVDPTVVRAGFEYFEVTPPDWRKGDGLVFARPTATLGFAGGAADRIREVQAALRTRLDAPAAFRSLAPLPDGSWRVVLERPGWYDVQAKAVLADGREVVRGVRAAVLGEPVPEDWRRASVFGLWNVHGDAELIRLAGARWNRRMTSFRDITSEAAAAAAAETGHVAPYEEKDGLSHVGVFSFGMPLWTMRLPENHAKPGFGNPFYPAKDWRDVARCVAAQARKAPLPRDFSMYNEPLAHWKGSHAELVDYARAVRDGLRSVSPDYRLGGPGLYSIRIGDLEKLAQAGLLELLDFIDLHAYVGGTPPEGDFLANIVALNDWLRAKGRADAPVTLTEFGWTAAAGTWQPHVDRWTQTQYVGRSLALGWSQGIDALIYFVLDFRTKNPGEAAFSLFDAAGRPEPGYAAFATVSKWFAASVPIGHYRLTPRAHLVLGRRGDRLQMGLWTTADSEPIRLPFAVDRAVDLLGAPVDAAQPLLASPDPLYLEAPADGLAALPVHAKAVGTDPREIGTPNLFWPLEAMATAPATLRSGTYAAFAKADDGQWRLLPFELVSPMHLESLELRWPADAAHPRIEVKVQSNRNDAEQAGTLWLADDPNRKATFLLPPNGRRVVHFDLADAVPGQRRESRVLLALPDGKVVDHALDWTVLAADPAAAPGEWADFTDWAPHGTLANTPSFDDCRGRVRVNHSAEGLRIEVRVTDDEHAQTHLPGNPMDAWSQDSLQLGFDMDVGKPWEAGFAGAGSSGTLGGHRVFEFTVAGRADGGSAQGVAFLHRSHDDALPANTVRSEVSVDVARAGRETRYDVRFPWAQLGVATPLARGDVFGIALAVNDVDPGRKAGRHGVRLFDGIVSEKDPKRFGAVWLR